MKTIKERAKQYAPDPFDPDYILPAREQYIVNQQRSAYITGAMEQKAIDIEKAKDAFNKTCGWLSTYPSCESWYNELFESFMKNMEE